MVSVQLKSSRDVLAPPFSPAGRLRRALILLDAGADPNIADRRCWTVLHQCARNGDLPLLEVLVRKGGDVGQRNNVGDLPVDLAVYRGHQPVVRYLELQSCDLKSLCRLSIRDSMGKRTYNRINELPLPPNIKLFVNYGNPYSGWQATVVPPTPWTGEELQEGAVQAGQVKDFICENATPDFVQGHKDVLEGGALQEVVEAFHTMYLWEAFRTTVDYAEPLARKPNYSMEMLKKKDGEDREDNTKQRPWAWWGRSLNPQNVPKWSPLYKDL